MRPVDIGICHKNNFFISAFFNVEFVDSNSCANRTYQRAYFFVGEHFFEPGLLDIENFALQGQYRLDIFIPAAFGGAACGVAFDQE